MRCEVLDAVQKYIIKEIQFIYFSQGQRLNDKHIEVIVKQMFSRIYIKDSGDTELLPGDIVEYGIFKAENEKQEAEGKNQLLVID
jgi:DNA-directed RNA polymerase subunit beta'